MSVSSTIHNCNVRNRVSVLNASVCVSLTQHRCQTYQWCPFHVRQTVERSDDVTVRRKIYCQACISGV